MSTIAPSDEQAPRSSDAAQEHEPAAPHTEGAAEHEGLDHQAEAPEQAGHGPRRYQRGGMLSAALSSLGGARLHRKLAQRAVQSHRPHPVVAVAHPHSLRSEPPSHHPGHARGMEDHARAHSSSQSPVDSTGDVAKSDGLIIDSAVLQREADQLDESVGQMSSGLGQDMFPADGTVEQARVFVKAHAVKGDDPNKWTQDQREAYNILAHDFGNRHARMHEQWHKAHGPGGTEGKGSGLKFLEFHRMMLREFTKETGIPAPGGWDPNSPIPAEFLDPDRKNPRMSTEPGVLLPAWLTLDGHGTKRGNKDFGRKAMLDDDKRFKSLRDFKSPDQLGRALGESGFHGSAHVSIGGTMGTFKSPKDPIFLAWHGYLDKLLDRWLKKTKNGKQWSQEHPRSTLLKSGGSMAPHPMHSH